MPRHAVFFCADAAYAPLAWNAARQAAAQADGAFDVHLLLTPGAAPGIAAPAGVALREIALPPALTGLPGPAHMSPAAYARLAGPDLWLPDYDRLLYIDSDTRIVGPLAPLFTLEMGNALVAMAEDCGRHLGQAVIGAAWDAYRAATCLPLDQPYFNSGVILMNAPLWRAEKLWARLLEFIAARGAALKFMDQDALNVLAAGRVLELSAAWNFCTHYMGLGLEGQVRPAILHFLNVLKPWRDPEWQILYGRAAVADFAADFAASPWPDFVHPGLLSRLPWRRHAARRAAQAARQVPEAALAGHVANFAALAGEISTGIARTMASEGWKFSPAPVFHVERFYDATLTSGY